MRLFSHDNFKNFAFWPHNVHLPSVAIEAVRAAFDSNFYRHYFFFSYLHPHSFRLFFDRLDFISSVWIIWLWMKVKVKSFYLIDFLSLVCVRQLFKWTISMLCICRNVIYSTCDETQNRNKSFWQKRRERERENRMSNSFYRKLSTTATMSNVCMCVCVFNALKMMKISSVSVASRLCGIALHQKRSHQTVEMTRENRVIRR